jgi:hypothetical protein
MRALSSTLSSNHTTARIHSDKEENVVEPVHPNSAIILITVIKNVNRHVAPQQKPRIEVGKDGPRGTVTQVELSS